MALISETQHQSLNPVQFIPKYASILPRQSRNPAKVYMSFSPVGTDREFELRTDLVFLLKRVVVNFIPQTIQIDFSGGYTYTSSETIFKNGANGYEVYPILTSLSRLGNQFHFGRNFILRFLLKLK